MTEKLPFGEDFARAWSRWLDYRREIKKPLKSNMAINLSLNQLRIVSEATAIEMIETSIRNHWTGIFPLNKEKKENRHNPTKEYTEYKPDSFDQSDFNNNLKNLITAYLNGGANVIDYGGAVHEYLTKKGLLSLSEERREEIKESVLLDKNRKRNNFEKPWMGSVDTECKRIEVQVFLQDCKEFQRDITKEL